jgi:flagellar basal-body rod protein FlgF
MADGIYISMAAATARERQLESVADDLSNAQTPGFKSARPAFAAVLAEAGGSVSYPALVNAGIDLRPGSISETGNPLHLLPEDGSFLGVARGDGTLAFTRDGRLSIDGDGTVRAAGLPIVTTQGNLVRLSPDGSLSIGADGRITSDGAEVGQVAFFQLDGATERQGRSLIVPAEGGTATPVESKVRTGVIEVSNRSTLDSTIEMVSVQRSFDAAMQAIETYKQMDAKASEAGKVR